MSEHKICSRCNISKLAIKDFYMCQGKWRSECKKCTIKKNVNYQKKIQAWKNRFVNKDHKRSYMVDYYSKNKQKFAEYRRQFKERYPNYYTDYLRRRKDEKEERDKKANHYQE